MQEKQELQTKDVAWILKCGLLEGGILEKTVREWKNPKKVMGLRFLHS